MKRFHLALAVVALAAASVSFADDLRTQVVSTLTKLAKGDLSVQSSIAWEELKVNNNGQTMDVGKFYRAQTPTNKTAMRKNFINGFKQGFENSAGKNKSTFVDSIKMVGIQTKGDTAFVSAGAQKLGIFKKRNGKWILISVG